MSEQGGAASVAPALYLCGGIMYGWCTLRPRHGGRLVADHLLQVILFASALPLLAQEAGDGFTSSDRTMLQEIHTRTASIKNDTTSIRQDATAIRNDVGDISDAVDDLLDYASSHSDSLHNIYQDTQHIRTFVDDIVADINGIYGNSTYLPTIHTDLVSVRQQLQYLRGDISDIPDQVTQINGHLLNIDRETTDTNDKLDEIKTILTQFYYSQTNAAANVITYRMFTNALNQIAIGKPTDLTMVTNLATWAVSFADPTLWYGRFGDDYPLYSLLNAYFGQIYGDGYSSSDFNMVWANSPLGFLLYLYESALFPGYTPTPPIDGFDEAWRIWAQGAYQDFPAPTYSIFEAYNTLGLGVLTNQANTLISQGVYVTNSLAVIVSNLVASLSVAEKTKDALYYPEDSETIYETTNHYSIPEWEPTYHAGIADNTNHYYYFQQADSFTRSLIGNYTSLLGRVIGGIKPQHRDWDAKITWSGWPSMQGQYGGWDLDVKLPDTPDVVDFAKYIKFLSRLVCFVLDLLIVLLGATRIHKTVMGGKLPFES